LSLEWGGLKTDLRVGELQSAEATHIGVSPGLDNNLTLKSFDPRGHELNLVDHLRESNTRGRRQAGIGFIPDDDGQCLDVGDPDWSNDAQLAHMSAQGVDRLGSVADEQSTRLTAACCSAVLTGTNLMV